jgi:hypothetical protein
MARLTLLATAATMGELEHGWGPWATAARHIADSLWCVGHPCHHRTAAT